MRLSYNFHLFLLVFPTISNCSIVLSNGPKQLTKHLQTKTTGGKTWQQSQIILLNFFHCRCQTISHSQDQMFIYLRGSQQFHTSCKSSGQMILDSLHILWFFQIGSATKFCASHILSAVFLVSAQYHIGVFCDILYIFNLWTVSIVDSPDR